MAYFYFFFFFFIIIIITYLGNELNYFDKYIEGRVPGHDRFGALGKEGVNDGLQARVRGRVTLALDADHVNP